MVGISASPGIALGKVLKLIKEEIVINKELIKTSDIDTNIAVFKDGLEKSREQISALKNHTAKTMGEDKAAIFDAHLEILNDYTLIDSVTDKITNELKSVDAAVDNAITEICEMLESIEDEYLRERASDVRDVCGRLMRNIKGIKEVSLSNLSDQVIVVAKDLAPSDTASMDLKRVLGFATDVGGRTSHSAIMARSKEIPAVVGTGNVSEVVKDGDFIILDGSAGVVIVNPSNEEISKYERKRAEYLAYKENLVKVKEFPGTTVDGHRVELCANIGNVKDVEGALNNGAEGIGLYRTEFLYMDNTHFPTEDEQFVCYREVAEKMNGKPVIIRTLDIGGDKDLPYFKFTPEMNPFLGWRAIRMCLECVDIFKTQLRAILKASSFGKIYIMFPMIISLEELRKAKSILEECKSELKNEGTSFDENIKVGIMVETPAAVVIADKLAKEADFFSIGTNDLTQYTLAVDRGNEKISKLYNFYHPAVLSSIKRVINESHKAGKWTGMCGEMAGDERSSMLLLGMGLDEFSMSASSIPMVKSLIRRTSYKAMTEMALTALQKDTADEVEAYVSKTIEELI